MKTPILQVEQWEGCNLNDDDSLFQHESVTIHGERFSIKTTSSALRDGTIGDCLVLEIAKERLAIFQPRQLMHLHRPLSPKMSLCGFYEYDPAVVAQGKGKHRPVCLICCLLAEAERN